MSDLAERVRRAVADLPVLVVWLFGSAARGQQRPGSDTDLAVLADPRLSSAQRWELRLGLLDRLGAEGVPAPDVVMVEEAPLRLQARVSEEGRVLLSRDEPARVAWTSRVFREHADFALLQDGLDRQMLGEHAAGRR
jgi:predicted nucleotidyltransferase